MKESHDICQHFLYKDLNFGDIPSDEYVEKGYNAVRRRLVLGGYRLAELLIKYYDRYEAVAVAVENGQLDLSHADATLIKFLS